MTEFDDRVEYTWKAERRPWNQSIEHEESASRAQGGEDGC
ncbi:hypothetical protein PVAP13_5NG170966 [Panicum virgatum]|uniref:Uncharacterized protein n=1 Tax=Panicum virgatum TaxID=38727 RepID=A0A8T0S5D6_PANVG|nr:hypothetical protein PVAP13_5NG170966 [Panicum virgatum]